MTREPSLWDLAASWPNALLTKRATAMVDGVMKMRRLEKGLEISAGKSVELKPGGYHLMFTGLREGLKEKQTITGTLTFEKAHSRSSIASHPSALSPRLTCNSRTIQACVGLCPGYCSRSSSLRGQVLKHAREISAGLSS